ncbi:hypothetical protein XACW160_510228 [Xanthomonas citri pv. citri]|nr:hypothetical protein XACW160_510228 [Xanthomonas citri pv. citri]
MGHRRRPVRAACGRWRVAGRRQRQTVPLQPPRHLAQRRLHRTGRPQSALARLAGLSGMRAVLTTEWLRKVLTLWKVHSGISARACVPRLLRVQRPLTSLTSLTSRGNALAAHPLTGSRNTRCLRPHPSAISSSCCT